MGHSSATQFDDAAGQSAEAQPRRSTPIAGNPSIANRARVRPARLLVICGVLLTAAVTAGTGLILSSLRERAVVDSERELQNIALVLAEQADRAFQAVDLVQTSLIERMQALGIASSEDYERQMSGHDAHLMLKDKIGGLPHVDAVAMIDAHGNLMNLSRAWPVPPVNVSDRSYFKALNSDAQLTALVSEPVLNRVTGTWTIFRVRKIVGANGQFLGVVLGAIQLGYFEHLFGSIALGNDSAISLFRNDGLLLARYPARDSPGGSYAQGGLFKNVLSHTDHGAARITSIVDGEERLVAGDRLAHYPIVVGVAKTVDAALAEWRSVAISMTAAVALLMLVIGATVLPSIRQIKSYEFLVKARAENDQKVQLDAALNNMRQGLLMFDAAGRLVVYNQRFLQMYNLSAEAVKPGCTLSDLLRLRKAAGTFKGNPDGYVAKLVDADGTFKGDPDRQIAKLFDHGKVETKVMELPDGRIICISNQSMPGGGWVSTHDDITERRRAEERIAHLAHHDMLTDLPNRLLFSERLDQALARVHRGERLAVLYLDLDHFKRINDTLGHSIGDELLKAVADRLRGCVREIDSLARLGGDEFAIVQTSIEQPSDAAALATRIREAVKAPYVLDSHKVEVDVSIGIAIAPNDGTERDQLLKNADLALYGGKTAGRGIFCFFEPDMNERMKARHALERDLRNALAAGEFELFYQPLVNLQDNAISAVEALLRWHHPERGMVSPAEFISVAEEIGLIIPLGEWVLKTACATASTWPDNIRISVNLSPAQLTSNDLMQVVISALTESGLPARRLELEITESVLMQNTFATLDTLHQLRQLGVRIAMDDFGTGHSSLSYLLSFPFDEIKIDRCFIKGLPNESNSLAIVRAIAGLANSLNMTTIAEGVETEQQWEMVKALGCTEMQGYFFSPPSPAGEIARLLRSHAEKAAAAA